MRIKNSYLGETPKLFYSSSEAAILVGVKPYVLRFWEKEFPVLRIEKSEMGYRRYRQADIDMLLKIKDLLYEQGFTIPGAIRYLEKEAAAVKTA